MQRKRQGDIARPRLKEILAPRKKESAPETAHHTPLLKIPVWWRLAVLPSLPWVVCFLSFFFAPETRGVTQSTCVMHAL